MMCGLRSNWEEFCAQMRPNRKKKGLPLVDNPLCINKLNGCGGLQCTETASLILPFRYSLTDGLAA
jgi:hypothetical protein